MTNHTSNLIDAVEVFISAANAYADRFTELRRTDSMRDGGNGRRDRAILNFMSAEEHYIGRREATHAAIAKAREQIAATNVGNAQCLPDL